MWVKIVANNVTRTQVELPPSEQLPDGRWVTGFPNSGIITINAAGWYSAPDPAPRPDNGFQQILTWSWNGTAASSTWVQGSAILPDPRIAAKAAAVTLADIKALI